MSTKVWINGKFIGIKDAKVSIFDRGFLYGDGAFETMRSYAGVVFKLDEHLSRLFKTLKVLKIKPPFEKKALENAIYKSLKINGLTGAYIRLSITRGEGRFGISYNDSFTPNIVITAKGFEDYPEWMHSKGISAKVVDIRQNEFSPLSRIKSLNFLNYILARYEAKERGFDEAILRNYRGYIVEAATSNIFLVKREVVITPSLDSGILPGITRGLVIGIAKKLRMKVIEKNVSCNELITADEVFLTNSLGEVLPVARVDGRPIGAGSPGDITKLLHISYQKEVIRDVLR